MVADPLRPWHQSWYRYSHFQQACRAFRPSELLPKLAATALALGEPPYSTQVLTQLPPWGLAAAARESLLHGNEHRSKPVDRQAILRLMRHFADADAPMAELDDEALVRIMTRLTYEQFPLQESIFEEVARPHAWIVEGLGEVETKVITPDSLTAALDGMTLREAIGATFFLQVGANMNGGMYDPSWLDRPEFKPVLDLYPRAHIERTAARLTATVEEYRADFAANSTGDPGLARYDYNPLVATPFVWLGDGPPIAPVPRLILRTVSPGGLYYRGLATHGAAFAEDLGHLFEHYIGRQLKLLYAEVHPEIAYGSRGGDKSVDWFVVLPHLVLLVEVKSRRLGPGPQAGDPTLFEKLARTLAYSRRQLERTIEALGERAPWFAHIPTDRPMLGVIVTAEPFYTGAAYLLDHDLATLPGGALDDVPVAVASARDIEMLVTHGHDAEGMLLDAIANRGVGIVGFSELGKKAGAEIRILATAWESYPWPASR